MGPFSHDRIRRHRIERRSVAGIGIYRGQSGTATGGAHLDFRIRRSLMCDRDALGPSHSAPPGRVELARRPADRRCYARPVAATRSIASPASSGTLVAESSPKRDGLDPYPSSDGLALQGTTWHEAAVRLLHEALERRFSGREDLIIASELVLYYEPAPIGGRGRSLIPDLMVVFGVSAHGRSSYKLWEEGGRVPQFVLEVASASTVDRDCEFKKGKYERLGVREYWQLDQTGLLLPQPLRGYRLVRGRYARIGQCGPGSDGQREYRSVVLGLMLRAKLYREGWIIVCRDERTGRDIAVGEAMDRLLAAAEERRRQAEAGQRQAEEGRRQAEAGQRQAEEGRRRAEAGQRQAEEGRRRAEAGQRQAEEGRQRAEAGQRQAEEGRRRAEAQKRAETQARVAAERRVKELMRQLDARQTPR